MGWTDWEAQVADIALLDQPLRQQLYALLVEGNAWVGRDAAASALEVPRSVAVFHLDKLAEAGLVEVRFERLGGRGGPGAGRPAKLYRRSDKEISISLPDRRYDLAGTVLAEAITDAAATGRPVEAAVAEAAHRTGHQIGAAARDELRASRSAAAVRGAALKALERLGYEPHRHDDDIVLVNCPFHSLAERHRSLVCGMNLDLLQGMIEGLEAADHLAARLQPADGMCCVRLRIADQPSGALGANRSQPQATITTAPSRDGRRIRPDTEDRSRSIKAEA